MNHPKKARLPQRALMTAILFCGAGPVAAQQSVGRGWPMEAKADWVGAGVPFYNIDAATAKGGAAPKGITPLRA